MDSATRRCGAVARTVTWIGPEPDSRFTPDCRRGSVGQGCVRGHPPPAPTGGGRSGRWDQRRRPGRPAADSHQPTARRAAVTCPRVGPAARSSAADAAPAERAGASRDGGSSQRGHAHGFERRAAGGATGEGQVAGVAVDYAAPASAASVADDGGVSKPTPAEPRVPGNLGPTVAPDDLDDEQWGKGAPLQARRPGGSAVPAGREPWTLPGSITLADSEPLIWRDVDVRSDLTLDIVLGRSSPPSRGGHTPASIRDRR